VGEKERKKIIIMECSSTSREGKKRVMQFSFFFKAKKVYGGSGKNTMAT
jgi:hypothetical protein